jgi:serralysin
VFGSATTATTTAPTGNRNIDGLLDGTQWKNTPISYSFTDNFNNDYEAGYPISLTNSSYSANFQPLNSAQRSAEKSWIDAYSNVSNLDFAELTGDNDRDATLRIAMSDGSKTGETYFPGNSVQAGDTFFNTTNYNNPTLGTYAYRAFGHELGHALGLKHAQEKGGVSNIDMSPDRTSMEFSIMSYKSYVGAPDSVTSYTNAEGSHAQSLMMSDISAVQQMYGADFGYNASNTNYNFSSTTGEMFINGVGQGTPLTNTIFRTIWDGNGIDTYDFSNYNTNLNIDLSPGNWSDLDVNSNFQAANLGNGNFARGEVFNALQYNNDPRSLIENAVGGAGNDVLTGNNADNILVGKAGNDRLLGGNGNDALVGGVGADTFAFGNPAEGIDTINDFAVGVDKIGIFASGFGAGLSAGVALNNDRFLSVTTDAASTIGDRVFVYNSTTGGLYFDGDGAAAGLAVQFAILAPNLNLTAADFTIV